MRTRVLVGQMTAIDPEKRLGERVGRLSRHELDAVGQAVRDILDVG